jgi:hypothetical protein
MVEIITKGKDVIRSAKCQLSCKTAKIGAFPLLDRFAPETDGGRQGSLQHRNDKGHEEIARIFTECNREFHTDDSRLQFYAGATARLSRIDYSELSIQGFVSELSGQTANENTGVLTGLFLSALVNSCKYDNFTLNLEHFPYKIFFFGYENTKSVIVRANELGDVGRKMKGGNLEVFATVIDAGNRMEDGTLVIRNDAFIFENFAYEMTGGKVEVHGDVRLTPKYEELAEPVGKRMDGGAIHIFGKLFGILPEDATGGDIYQFDRLLMKDGKVIDKPNSGETA